MLIIFSVSPPLGRPLLGKKLTRAISRRYHYAFFSPVFFPRLYPRTRPLTDSIILRWIVLSSTMPGSALVSLAPYGIAEFKLAKKPFQSSDKPAQDDGYRLTISIRWDPAYHSCQFFEARMLK